MNRIEVRSRKTIYGYEENCWFVDGRPLPEYLDEWAKESGDERFAAMSFGGVCPAWSKAVEYEGDRRFVWKTIDMDKALVPLLLCEDDLDFSCIVIVVETEKIGEYVYWDRIGYVTHDNEDWEQEKRSGILYIDSYTDEDWEQYGDNIAWAECGSHEWCEWIGAHWAEELYRRRMNYTLPYYQRAGSVRWIKTMDWVFPGGEYEDMVERFWDMETLGELHKLFDDGGFAGKASKTFGKEMCAKLMAGLTRDGWRELEQHLRDYGEILLHLLAGDLLTEPLLDLAGGYPKRELKLRIYCKFIECMWRYGDEDVVNVVDVTILERLSDRPQAWELFGRHISDEFVGYINSLHEDYGWINPIGS